MLAGRKVALLPDQITNGVLRISAGGGKPEVVPAANPPNSLTSQATLSPAQNAGNIYSSIESRIEDLLQPDRACQFGFRRAKPRPRSRFESGIPFSGTAHSAGYRFSPDGKSLAFVIDEAGQDNIRIQPLDGSNVRKLTNFNDSERIQDFRWPPTASRWPCCVLVLSPMSSSYATPATVRGLLRDNAVLRERGIPKF